MNKLRKRLAPVLVVALAVFGSEFAHGREDLEMVFVPDSSGSMRMETAGLGYPFGSI